MECKNCGEDITSDPTSGLVLECSLCEELREDCTCISDRHFCPDRWVHCLTCEELFKYRLDPQEESGWRDYVV